jgi:hypothetical protein
MRPIIILATLLVLTTPAFAGRIAAHPITPEPTTAGLPLRYTVARNLPLGFHVEAAPGLMVGRGGKRGAQVVGLIGTVELETPADLLIFKGEAQTLTAPTDRPTTQWWIGVHLGGALKPARLAGHLLTAARSVL